jgi:hypothetical protein
MKLKSVVLGLVAAVGLSGAASAKTVTFDFSAASSGSWASSLSYNVGGVGLTVTGSDTTGAAGHVQTWAGHGLGVKSATDCTFHGACFGSDHQVDSNGRKDIVNLAFSQAVSITQIAFSYVDQNDTFDFYLSGNKLAQLGVSPLVSVNSALGNLFGIGAGVSSQQVCSLFKGRNFCQTKWNFSAFKLTSITVDAPAAVPVPAAGLMLLGGVGALAMFRRKRRTA